MIYTTYINKCYETNVSIIVFMYSQGRIKNWKSLFTIQNNIVIEYKTIVIEI